jgi:hypothetical protein
MPSGAWYGPVLALGGAIVLIVPALVMWGFTVDDALIPLRYAQHLASGVGYRFNAGGPSTDGVTPLPWAFCLALLPRADLLTDLARLKLLGVLSVGVAGAALGSFLGKRAAGERGPTIHAAVALCIVGLAYPIGAWAASGMETGLATALAIAAVVAFERPRRAAVLAGLVAVLRPELVVWALAIAAGASYASRRDRTDVGTARAIACGVGIAVAPFALCTALRVAFFGRPFPLALLAKPSDLAHGLRYASAASIVVLTPLLVLARASTLARASALSLALVLAALGHVIVVVAVGGDWMPYARLLVPVAPTLAVVHVDLSRVAYGGDLSPRRVPRGLASGARAAVAIALGIALAITGAPAGRHVYEDRRELVAKARPLLGRADVRVVAALDVGWVGAATDAAIVDLAGLTDPAIAALPGGHTSKTVDVTMLLERNVDTVVLYSAPRRVEERIRRADLFATHFVHAADVPVGTQGASYAIYRRR